MPAVESSGLVLVGLVIVVGLVGVVIPLLPGLLLCWGAVLVWALAERTGLGWAVLAFASVVVAVSQVVKYLVPGRRMRGAGVPWGAIAAGVGLGIVGFFVIPVLGLPLGFVLGVYAFERLRLGEHAPAWASTVHALKATGLSILIELGAGLLVGASWLGAVLVG
jgi:uncharacterized protein YqgC (DUF456 family)